MTRLKYCRSLCARLGGFFVLALSAAVCAAPPVSPVIAIIIDDLGQQRDYSLAVTRLPGPVACSVLPHTPWAAQVSAAAATSGKEVLLHLPLQAMETSRLAGIGEISLDNSREELQQILAADLASVPNAVGINNHMGSLITRHPGHMDWLMAEIATYQHLFFVDSYTTAQSIAADMAAEHGIPVTRRNIFLDNEPGEENLKHEYRRLLNIARKQGFAVAIGHPYPETTAFLQQVLPMLPDQGIRLVSVAELIAYQQKLQTAKVGSIGPTEL